MGSSTVGKKPFVELIGDLDFAYEHLSTAVAYSRNFSGHHFLTGPLFGVTRLPEPSPGFPVCE